MRGPTRGEACETPGPARRRRGWRHRLAVPAGVLGLAVGSVPASASLQPAPRAADAASEADLDAGSRAALDDAAAEATEHGEARVIVSLDVDHVPPDSLSATAARAQVRRLGDARAELVDRVAGDGRVRVVQSYDLVPAVALALDSAGVEALRQADGVDGVTLDVLSAPAAPRAALVTRPALAQSVPQVNADDMHSLGYTGAGQTVAVLDTGVDGSHAMLSGAVVGEACYSTTSAYYGSTSVCPGGVDSDTSGGGPCAGEVGGCFHGTHVASIAAGRPVDYGGSTLKGIAPGASVYAVQVFSRFDSSYYCEGDPPCALTWTSDQLAGLNRVYALRDTFDFAAVNMSLGGGKYTSPCGSSSLRAAIDGLHGAGIPVVVASGNDYYYDGISAPACDPDAVSVGAVSESDVVSSFSNSYQWLSLLAPGYAVTAALPGGGFGTYSGTSMATPHVAGAFALLRQAVPSASSDALEEAARSGGVPVLDTRNGFTFPRLDVRGALDRLTPTPPESPSPPTDVTPPSVPALVGVPGVTTDDRVNPSWWSSDSGSGVAGYELRRVGVRWTGEMRSPTIQSFGASTRSVVDAAAPPGWTRCYRARAHDGAGNYSAWSGPRCVTSPLDDRHLARSGRWVAGISEWRYRGTVLSTTYEGQRLSRSGAKARRIWIVATKCRRCGTVDVFFNGVLIRHLDLEAATTRYGELIPVKRWEGSRTGTLTIVHSGDARALVQIDGVGISPV